MAADADAVRQVEAHIARSICARLWPDAPCSFAPCGRCWPGAKAAVAALLAIHEPGAVKAAAIQLRSTLRD